jgi:hypothetical protein
LAWRVLLFALMCVGFFIFHIWMRTLVLTKGFEVGQRQRELARLDSEYMTVKVAFERLVSPENLQKQVERFARRGVDFASPTTAQLMYVGEDSPASLSPKKTPEKISEMAR